MSRSIGYEDLDEVRRSAERDIPSLERQVNSLKRELETAEQELAEYRGKLRSLIALLKSAAARESNSELYLELGNLE